MEIEGGHAFLRPNGGLFQAQHLLRCFVVLVNSGIINVPCPSIISGSPEDLYFKAVWTASSGAGDIWPKESHTCSGVPGNLSSLY